MVGHIYIYGEVGKQVTLDTVLKDISPKNSSYIVHIHSLGGDVFEGYAIYNAIKNTGKKITVHIEGLCASIATLIAASGSKIIMNAKAQFMIHNPRIASMAGDSRDLRNVAGQLDKIKSQLIGSWTERSTVKLSYEQLSDMYDHETWLTPEQALEMGFVDEVQEVLKAVATADIKKYNQMEDRKNFTSRILRMIDNFFSPKNATETLEDGRVVMVPDEGEWAGQPITLEDGTPLEDGTYVLVPSGTTIVVAGGVITEKTQPETEAKKEEEQPKDETPEDMELKEKLAAAEARIKELESAIQTSTQNAAKAEAKAKSFENKLNTDLKVLQEQVKRFENTTTGDATPPKLATNPVENSPVVNDPMQAWYQKHILDKRNTD